MAIKETGGSFVLGEQTVEKLRTEVAKWPNDRGTIYELKRLLSAALTALTEAQQRIERVTQERDYQMNRNIQLLGAEAEVARLTAENAELREDAEARTIYYKHDPSLSAAVETLQRAKVIAAQAAQRPGAPWVELGIVEDRITEALQQFQGVPAEKQENRNG